MDLKPIVISRTAPYAAHIIRNAAVVVVTVPLTYQFKAIYGLYHAHMLLL